MEKIISERGNVLVLFENFKFRNCGNTEKGVKWRCTNKNCQSKLYMDEAATVVLDKFVDHNHPQPKAVQIEAFRNGLKRKAADDICERPSKLINQELVRSSEILQTINIRDVSNVRKCLYRKRRSTFPKLPTDICETQKVIDILSIQTCKKENFVLENCYETNIVIFACESNLKFLSSCSTLYLDGTFDYAPKYFLQMFTLHGIKNGHYVPLVFCLLPDKRKTTYLRTFKIIQHHITQLGFSFEVCEIVADFEEAIQGAIREMWPKVTLTGCRFHLSQSWMRKIQQLGLIAEYKNPNSKIGQLLHWVFGLTFLEPRNVGDCFAFDFCAEDISDARLTRFFDYLTTNYIDNNARFPPSIWACNSATSQRTTNCCESFHSRFNKSFYQPHPNILQFIYVLNETQSNTYVKLNSTHLQKVISNNNYRNKLIFLQDLIVKYKKNEFNMFDFVKAASFQYNKLL